MKLIFKIARAELRNLFCSPIAWFLTVAFMVECAITYTSVLKSLATEQEIGGANLQYMTLLTRGVFTNTYSGLFTTVMQTLYLYIPLVTMGLISREMNGGTISLLYSSPVRVREIVFGKYLAMLFYSLVLLAVIGIFMVAGVCDIRSADYGMLLSAALGFYLLLCAYAAIGLFMSSLTSYQIVAAVSTFVTIGALSYIDKLWQDVDLVRSLTYFLSLSGRTHHMLGGLITTKDVIYFIVIVYLFLGLTIGKLQAGRETKPWYVAAGRYVLIIFSALVIDYVSAIPGLVGYWDTTAGQDNTLTGNTQKIIKELGDGKLEITSYTNILDGNYYFGLPERRNEYLQRWEDYIRFKPDIDFHYVMYYDKPLGSVENMLEGYNGKSIRQIAEQRAKGSDLDMSLFETPEQLQKEVDLEPELNRFVMKLSYNGRSTFLRVFNDQIRWPMEAEVSAAFKRLLQAKMPKIAFVTGDGERRTAKKGDREYRTITSDKTFRYSLINQGFDVDTISLNTRDIPAEIATLVLADPQTQLSPAAMQKVEDFIAKGGNLLIAGEPGRQLILNPLLQMIGLQMTNGMLEQKSEEYAPTLILPGLTKTAVGFSKMLARPSLEHLPVAMNGAAALSFRDSGGFTAEPLLITKTGMVSNTTKRNPDLDIANSKADSSASSNSRAMMEKHPDPATGLNPSIQAFSTAVALTRHINGKEQRIIVSGDADFLSNIELGRDEPQVSNFFFGTALFSWLDYGQFPIDASRPDAKDNRVTVSSAHVSVLKTVYIYVIPGLILLSGATFLLSRKRK